MMNIVRVMKQLHSEKGERQNENKRISIGSPDCKKIRCGTMILNAQAIHPQKKRKKYITPQKKCPK